MATSLNRSCIMSNFRIGKKQQLMFGCFCVRCGRCLRGDASRWKPLRLVLLSICLSFTMCLKFLIDDVEKNWCEPTRSHYIAWSTEYPMAGIWRWSCDVMVIPWTFPIVTISSSFYFFIFHSWKILLLEIHDSNWWSSHFKIKRMQFNEGAFNGNTQSESNNYILLMESYIKNASSW